jgi:hypothetical protein
MYPGRDKLRDRICGGEMQIRCNKKQQNWLTYLNWYVITSFDSRWQRRRDHWMYRIFGRDFVATNSHIWGSYNWNIWCSWGIAWTNWKLQILCLYYWTFWVLESNVLCIWANQCTDTIRLRSSWFRKEQTHSMLQ